MGTIPTLFDDEEDFFPDAFAERVKHTRVGSLIRPPASQGVIQKNLEKALLVGLNRYQAEVLVYAAANQQQLRKALSAPKTHRYKNDVFHYFEVDVLMQRVVESPDNIRFEGDHAHGEIKLPRYEALPGQCTLTMQVPSSDTLVKEMADRIQWVRNHNPHVETIAERGIETPGWLAFAQLTVDGEQPVWFLDATDAFGRTVGAHDGLGIDFEDALWNMRPGTRRGANLHRDVAAWAKNPAADEEQQRKVRSAVMPNAKIIFKYEGRHDFATARRRLVAQIHLAPPLGFTPETTINAKANVALDELEERDLLPAVEGLTPTQVRQALDGRHLHGLLPDEVAILACAALNPPHRSREVWAVNEAVRNLTGVSPKPNERSLMAAEVALRNVPQDHPSLQGWRSSLDRAWRWSAVKGATLSRRTPLQLLEAVEVERATTGGVENPSESAEPELLTLASFHLVTNALLTRSAHGAGRGNATEPITILRGLASTVRGRNQITQAILDLRRVAEPQFLPSNTPARDERIPGTELLTPANLVSLIPEEGEKPDPELVEIQTPQDQFANAIALYRLRVDALHEAGRELGGIEDGNGIPLVETVGWHDREVQRTMTELAEWLSDWRSSQRRAKRLAERQQEEEFGEDDDGEENTA